MYILGYDQDNQVLYSGTLEIRFDTEYILPSTQSKTWSLLRAVHVCNQPHGEVWRLRLQVSCDRVIATGVFCHRAHCPRTGYDQDNQVWYPSTLEHILSTPKKHTIAKLVSSSLCVQSTAWRANAFEALVDCDRVIATGVIATGVRYTSGMTKLTRFGTRVPQNMCLYSSKQSFATLRV